MTSARFPLVLLFLAATTALAAAKSPDMDDILGQGQDTFCPPYRCPKSADKSYVPIPRWPLNIETAGCQGVNEVSGIDFKHFEKCCDLQNACYQICGTMKDQCDTEFEKCMKASCEALPGLGEDIHDLEEDEVEKERESCRKLVGLVKMIRGMRKCREYDMHQRRNCECVEEEKAQGKMERLLNNYYKKYKPDLLGKVKGLVEKANGKQSAFVAILKQLVAKYPASIKTKVVEKKATPNMAMNGDEL